MAYGSLILLILFVNCCPGYDEVGCYKDTGSRTIPTLEGKDSILDGSYSSRTNPIAKCAVAAMTAGYSMFAVQDGGWCAASATAPQTFDKYGKSTACKDDGEGGPWANQVYKLEGKSKTSLSTELFFDVRSLDRRKHALSTNNDIIGKAQRRWAGHVCHVPGDRIPKQLRYEELWQG